MTARDVRARLTLEFYSYAQLAAMWHRAQGTIRNWVWAERRAGRQIVGFYRLTTGGARREFLIRGDSAERLRARYVRERVN
jgi:hypothetical protein